MTNNKMKKIGLIICITLLTLSVFGQQSGSNQTTSLCGGRWELFMSEIAAKISFKIDKYSGDVFNLVQQKNGALTWQLVKKEYSSKGIRIPDTINYQLFSSSLAIRYTFLINTNTGFTWQLVTDKNGDYLFEAVE